MEFDSIAREVLRLLEQQVQAIVGRNFDAMPQDAKDAYRNRKRRIQDLRSKLHDLTGA